MNDPYTSLRRCRVRLNDEYKKHGKIIVAYDFDGTVYDFHGEGYKFPRVIDLIQRVRPYAHLVVYTASKEERFPFIKQYLRDNNIPFDAINETPIGLNVPQGGKLYYNILLDDRAGLESALDTLEYFLMERLHDEIFGA